MPDKEYCHHCIHGEMVPTTESSQHITHGYVTNTTSVKAICDTCGAIKYEFTPILRRIVINLSEALWR